MGLTQPFLVSQRNVLCALTNFLLKFSSIIVLYDIFVCLSTNISRYFRICKGALFAAIEAIPLSAPTSRIAKPQKEAFLSETPPFLPTFGFFPLQTSQIRRPGLTGPGFYGIIPLFAFQGPAGPFSRLAMFDIKFDSLKWSDFSCQTIRNTPKRN